MIERILIAYDGSTGSEAALQFGSRLADRLGAAVIVGTSLTDEQLESSEETAATAFEKESKARLWAARAHMPAGASHRVDERAVISSSSADAVRDLAVAEQADLILIGSTHRGAAGRVLPGSLALQLIGSVPCPLGIVPGGKVGEDNATGPVVVAYDGGTLAKRALEFAAQLAAEADTALHVIGVAMSKTHLAAPIAGGVSGVGAQVEREALEDSMQAQLDRLPRDLPVTGQVCEGSAVECLVHAAGDTGGIFVSGSHGRGPLMSLIVGSVSNAVAQRISWPAILVPPQAEIGPDLKSE